MTKRNWLIGAFALVAVGIVAAVALVTIKPTTPASVSKAKRSAPVAADKRSLEGASGEHSGGTLKGGFGVSGGVGVGDILDDKTEPGIDLATARAQAAEGILIPSSKVLGNVKRVRLTQAPAPRENVGIAILYDSGVKFFSFADGRDKTFESLLHKGLGSFPFTDGRKAPYDVVSVGGRKYVVQKGGTQVAGKLRIEVKPAVVFLVDGIEYQLIAASGGLKASDLLKVAQEIH